MKLIVTDGKLALTPNATGTGSQIGVIDGDFVAPVAIKTDFDLDVYVLTNCPGGTKQFFKIGNVSGSYTVTAKQACLINAYPDSDTPNGCFVVVNGFNTVGGINTPKTAEETVLEFIEGKGTDVIYGGSSSPDPENAQNYGGGIGYVGDCETWTWTEGCTSDGSGPGAATYSATSKSIFFALSTFMGVNVTQTLEGIKEIDSGPNSLVALAAPTVAIGPVTVTQANGSSSVDPFAIYGLMVPGIYESTNQYQFQDGIPFGNSASFTFALPSTATTANGGFIGTVTISPICNACDIPPVLPYVSKCGQGDFSQGPSLNCSCAASCFQVGSSSTWTAPCDGYLTLYYNDTYFVDNTGSFIVSVEAGGVTKCYEVFGNADPALFGVTGAAQAVRIAVVAGTNYTFMATGSISNTYPGGPFAYTGGPNGRVNTDSGSRNKCPVMAVNYACLAASFSPLDSSASGTVTTPITCPSTPPCGLYNLALVDNSSGGNFTGAASDLNNYSLSFTAQSVAVNSTTLTPLITATYPNASSPMAGTSFSGVATNEGTGGTTPVTITPILFFDTGSGAWALVMEFTDPVTGFTGITTGFNGSGMMSPVGAYGGQGTVTTC